MSEEADPRSPERLRHHFEVERELARTILETPREHRSQVFKTLYSELFDRVPDHPRLLRRETPESSKRAVNARMNLIRPWIKPASTLVEFAPGDCRLAYAACALAGQVIAADISDQRAPGEPAPANFRLVVYDGYHLPIKPASADLAFSYQFLEHLHPEDVPLHFACAATLLKPGGRYVFSTPHRFSGPHDISRFFSDTPLGFHLKEWTFREARSELRRAGFRDAFVYRRGKARCSAAANLATLTLERLFATLPRKLQRKASARLFQSVTMMGVR